MINGSVNECAPVKPGAMDELLKSVAQVLDLQRVTGVAVDKKINSVVGAEPPTVGGMDPAVPQIDATVPRIQGMLDEIFHISTVIRNQVERL